MFCLKIESLPETELKLDQTPRGGVTTIQERNTLVEEYLPYIQRLANKMLRAGQRPTITRDDLLGVGYESLVRDLTRVPDMPLEHALRHAKTLMIQFAIRERTHWNQRKPWTEMFDEHGQAQF
jgi:hypothetical protein